ncbi:MAG: EAL domain-containing protein [Gammaproteobacteria bacterium]|nr:MAG: EAL domain-containing protein [Gammaproteobacteria bacterium]
MTHPNPHSANLEELSPLSLEYALLAPDVAAWRLDVISGALLFSKEFSLVFLANQNPFQHLSSLMDALSPADKYIFKQTFNSHPDDLDSDVRACEVNCMSNVGDYRVRFIGRLVPNANTRQFEGVAVPSKHWLANPGSETSSSLLRTLFAENPIASLMTDAKGVLLQANNAFEKLFEINSRKISAAVGRYNLLHDKKLLALVDSATSLAKVYESAECLSVDLDYSVSSFSKKITARDKEISLRASLLPIRNRYGDLERVLIQLQDRSREESALKILMEQQRKLQESEASYKAFIANSSEAIWCYDMVPPISLDESAERQADLMEERAQLSQGNKMLVTMLGATSLSDIIGMGLRDSGSTRYVFDLKFFVNNNFQMVDHDIIREDSKGRRFYFQISCVGVVENNCLTRVWGTTKDVTVRKRYEHRLEHVSMHDALTGLPNRANIYQEIERFYAAGGDAQGALLFIDLDRFKEINDTLGHQVGDRLLQLIGPRIASEMTDVSGTVARMGGDEFAIFLPSIRNQQHAVVFAHCILDALRLEFDLEVFCAEISASIGIALAPTQASDVNELMRYADVAMYYAKEQMSGIAVYKPEIDPHSPKRLAMMSELGRAIREDQLCLYYQPKVSLGDKSFYGFEALLRWNHPELGFVPPNDFIPIAEVTSLIHPLTAWVLEKSIAQCRLWHSQGLIVSVAVNLSARNLLDENMPKLVRTLLQKYDLPASALELEITESSIMSDPSRALRVLQQLHELGTQLSIDDFGTGYSSLAYLKKLPVQTLKIDYSFIRNMLDDKQDELIVESTIHLAHSLSLKVVAEGVENAALIDRLSSMGCDEAQGYHIGRPMPLSQIDEWMAESSWTDAH